MSDCEHKHTGSCSPAGVYLYVKCMDCGAILNESEDGRRLRAGCPGFKAERYASGSCEHCHHDAQYHCDSLRARLAEADALLRDVREDYARAMNEAQIAADVGCNLTELGVKMSMWINKIARIDAHLARKP